MKVIYTSIIWFAILILGLIGSAVSRRSGEIWEKMPDARGNYDLLYGLIGIYLFVCIIGLMRKKKWGYSFSVTAFSIFTFLPLGLFFVSIYLVMPYITLIEIVNINLTNLIVGVVSLIIWVWFTKSKIKDIYSKY